MLELKALQHLPEVVQHLLLIVEVEAATPEVQLALEGQLAEQDSLDRYKTTFQDVCV